MELPSMSIAIKQDDHATPELSANQLHHGIGVVQTMPQNVIVQSFPVQMQSSQCQAMYTVSHPSYSQAQPVQTKIHHQNLTPNIQHQDVLMQNNVHDQMQQTSRQPQVMNHTKAIVHNQAELIGSDGSDILVQGVVQNLAIGQGEVFVQDKHRVVYVAMPESIANQTEGEVEIIVTTQHLSADDDGTLYSLHTNEDLYQEIGSSSAPDIALPLSVCEYNTDLGRGQQTCQGEVKIGGLERLVSLPSLTSTSGVDAIYDSAVCSGIIRTPQNQIEYTHYNPVSNASLVSTSFQSSVSQSDSVISLSQFANCSAGKYVATNGQIPLQTIYVTTEADSTVVVAAGTPSTACQEYVQMTPIAQELYEKQETMKSLELVDAQWQSAVEESPQMLLRNNSGLDTEALNGLATVAASVDQNSMDLFTAKDNSTGRNVTCSSISETNATNDNPVALEKENINEEGVNCDVEEACVKEEHIPEDDDEEEAAAAEESYCCSKCELGFVEIGQLHKHVLSTHELKFKCEECEKTFTTSTYLKTHMRCHTGEKIHVCDVCGEDFTFSNTLRRHRLKYHKEAVWRCEDCDKEFLSESVFKRHMNDHVAKPKRGRKPKMVSKKGTKTLVSKSKVKAPISNRPQTRSLQKKKMELSEKTKAKEPVFSCILCQEKFKSKLLLKKHAKIHLGQRILRCDKCGKLFQDSVKLKMHKLTHTGQSYPCEFCGRSFSYAFTLMTHKKSHATEKGFKCKLCRKRFATVELLKVHRACHAPAKPFVCDVCTKAFTSQHYLKTHQKVHKGDSYYGCMLCGESFKLSSWLRKHSQKVHAIGRCKKKSKKCTSVDAGANVAVGDGEVEFNDEMKSEGEGQGRVLQDGSLDVEAEKDADGMLQCKWCNKKLQSKPAFNTHIKTHVEFPFSCDKCDKTFSQDMYLQKHLLRHQDAPLHHCDYCQKGFRSSAYLAQHRLIHTGQKLYQCQLCDEEFVFATSLRRHLKNHEGIGPNKSGLVRRRKIASVTVSDGGETNEPLPPNLNCTLCGMLFTNSKQIEEHVQVHRGEDATFECSLCRKSFSSHRALWRHRQFHVDSSPIACSICNKTFRTTYYLKSHMNVHSGTKPYKCNYCDEVFTHTSTRRRHQRVHIPEDQMNHMCNICGKKFYDQSDFDRHMLNHTGEKPFMCDICGKTYASKPLLKSHLNRHNGKRQYECTICNKSFLHQYRLQRHYLTHSDVKAHKCPMCDRRFHMDSYLQTHMRSHTGEKPYHCEICKEEFTHSNTFRRHKRIHDGKTLNCKVCGKMCLELFDLNRHMQSHSDDKPIMCDICGKTFSHQGSCTRHMKRIHSTTYVMTFPVDENVLHVKVQSNSDATAAPITLTSAPTIPASVVAEVALTATPVSTLVSMTPLTAATESLTTLTPLTSVIPPQAMTTLSQAEPVCYPRDSDTVVISL